jgi:soluble lytic murein transglycosylase-like protein
MAQFTTVPSGQVPQLIANAASTYGVPSQLALEVAVQESGLNQTAISSAGAIGVMQLEPATAAGLGVNPYDTTQNINGGVQYLAQLLSQFGGDQSKALAAYNAGPGAVQKAIASNGANYLSALPAETQNYVSSILGATGSAYSPSVTPSSVANGASGVLDTLSTALGGAPWGTILLLTTLAIGAYFAGDLLGDVLD